MNVTVSAWNGAHFVNKKIVKTNFTKVFISKYVPIMDFVGSGYFGLNGSAIISKNWFNFYAKFWFVAFLFERIFIGNNFRCRCGCLIGSRCIVQQFCDHLTTTVIKDIFIFLYYRQAWPRSHLMLSDDRTTIYIYNWLPVSLTVCMPFSNFPISPTKLNKCIEGEQSSTSFARLLFS